MKSAAAEGKNAPKASSNDNSTLTTKVESFLTFEISGMTCSSCVRRIEKVLLPEPTIHEASVNLSTEEVRIGVLDGEPVALAKVIGAIEGAGYRVEKKSAELSIEGMTCASCVRRVERSLLAVPGVLTATVCLATERVRVHFIGLPHAQALVAAVAEAGYRAHAVSETGEPRLVAEKEARREESAKRDVTRLCIGAALSAPLVTPMLLAFFAIQWTPPGWVELLLATPVQFWLGWRFYRAGWRAVRRGAGNMDLLVALGTSASFGLSVYNLVSGTIRLCSGHLNASEVHRGAGSPLYFESSATVITLVLFGKWLEDRSKRQTGESIRSLRALRSNYARIMQVDGAALEVDVETVKTGDLVLIRPGERIPVDGVIRSGTSHVDESLITGENLPVARIENDRVSAGAINGEGLLTVQTTAVGDGTMLSAIIRMVEDAQAAKAPVQLLVDKVSAVFVPSVLIVALSTFLGWWLLGHAPFQTAVMNAVAVLVIACPCALGLATPTAIMVGVGAAARSGILIRNAEVLQLAHAVTTVAFDKTGTLTEGHPVIVTYEAAHEAGTAAREHILSLAGSLQAGSEHPLARALDAEVAAQNIRISPASSVHAMPGRGISGIVNGQTLQFVSRNALFEIGQDPELSMPTLHCHARDFGGVLLLESCRS